MKILITESQYNKAIDKYLTYLFEPHEVKISEKYPYSVFWVKDGKVIAEIENSKKFFWVRYSIWDEISSMFSFHYNEIPKVIKPWLKEHYGLGSLTPRLVSETQEESWKNITD